MRTYTVKHTIKAKCPNCGRAYVRTVSGAIDDGDTGDWCPHCESEERPQTKKMRRMRR